MVIFKKSTFYDVLEVESTADQAKIKAAYRRLARQYHPDINPENPDAEDKFKEVGEAYSTLSDPKKRLIYDQTIGILRKARPRGNPAPGGPSPENARPDPTAENKTAGANPANGKTQARQGAPKSGATQANDNNAARFKDMFDSLFKKEESKRENRGPDRKESAGPKKPENTDQQAYGPKPNGHKPVRGEDLSVDAMIHREEAQHGVTKTINIQQAEPCKRCSGTGRVNGNVCTVCHGEKQIITHRKLDVRIPQGVKTGSKVRVAKEGGKGVLGGEPGDLYIMIRLIEDQALKIDGLNVSNEIRISMPEAVLGTEVDVPTIHGHVKMMIPPLTSSGKMFRLKGQGISASGVSGDQFVTVEVVAPKALTPRQKEHYEALLQLQKEENNS